MYHFWTVLGYLLPFTLVVATSLFFKDSRAIRIFFVITAWMTGFVIHQWAGNREATRMMVEATQEQRSTEADLTQIPDGPNITAMWIVTGWIPLLLASVGARHLNCKKRASLSS